VVHLKAYWETEHAAAQKEQEKRQQAALNRWTKLVQGLRIRQRVREQYGGGTHESGAGAVGNVCSSPAVASGNGDDHDGHDDEGEVATVGGYLAGVEDVVQHYSLPRPIHVVFSSPPRSPNPNGSPHQPSIAGPVPGPGILGPSSPCFLAAADDDDGGEAGEERGQQDLPTFPEDVEMDNMSGLELESTQHVRRMPKSMAALAAEAEAEAQAQATSEELEGQGEAASTAASRSLRSASRATPRTKPKPKPKTETETQSRAKMKTPTTAGTPSRSSQSRSRKRTRTPDDDDDDDDGDDDEVAASESGSDGGGPRAAKRARKHRRGFPADANANGGLLAPVPPSDRVLRTRKGKSPALLERGHEEERAIQRALAG
jgi:xeroderma pigmentosum group C-complementing protein